jgi:hypothetical protein
MKQDTRSQEAKEAHDEFEDYFWLGVAKWIRETTDKPEQPLNPFPENEGT